MKRLLIGAAIAASLTLPTFAGTEMAPMSGKDMKQMAPLAASDAGFYVAGYGGANFDTWYGDKEQTVSAAGTNIVSKSSISSGWGGVGGVKVGYNFESFDPSFLGLKIQPAVEAEGLYIGESSHVSQIFFPGVAQRFTTNSGDFFLNGILRFKNSSIVTPYLGGGVGLQYLTQHNTVYAAAAPNVAITGLNTSDLDFAGQGLIGLDVAVCPHLSLFTEYKFIDAIGTDAKSNSWPGNGVNGGITYRFKPDQIEQNLITGGVKYTF